MKNLLSVLILVLWSFSASADVICIDANGTGDYPTIQAAIDDANDGDVIILQPGIYTGNGNCDIDFLGKAITVKSESGPGSCIIDCNGSCDENHRGFYFINDEGADSVLEGLTIANAFVAVMCEGGAGIYIRNASPTIDNCIIINNHAELEPMSLCFCCGGGIYIGAGSSPVITNCIISENSVGDWGMGGGIYCDYSETDITLRDCLIANNTALGYDSSGGGIYCDYESALNVSNCTIVDNHATDGGGGIYFYSYKESPLRIIGNSIIWGNSPDQIYNNTAYGYVAIPFSYIQGGWPFPSGIDIDPCFADPNSDNFRLLRNSPFIDAGHNSLIPIELTEDLDGRERIVDGDCNGTEIVDLGAYEFSYVSLGDFAGGCDVNFQDFVVFGLTWLLDDQHAGYNPDCDISLPIDGLIDEKDLQVFVDNWLLSK